MLILVYWTRNDWIFLYIISYRAQKGKVTLWNWFAKDPGCLQKYRRRMTTNCSFCLTFCRETKALARAGLRNPATVSVAVRSKQAVGHGATNGNSNSKIQATPTSLENFYITCQPEEKLAQLVGFLKVRWRLLETGGGSCLLCDGGWRVVWKSLHGGSSRLEVGLYRFGRIFPFSTKR